MNGPTVAEILREAQESLAAAGVPSPEVDARLLLAHVLGCRHLDLALAPGRRLEPAERERFADLLLQRAARIPLQLLLGDVEFFGRRFQVAPAVLIPRPETETVVEVGLALLDARGTGTTPTHAADIGSGAGVIGLTLAAERPRLQVVCIDRSQQAVRLTRANALALEVASRVLVVRGDSLAPLAREAFDLVISNPPYLRSAVIPGLEPEVRDHDPRLALDGGPDGLAHLRRLAEEGGALLRPGGSLVVEIGDEQSEAAQRLLADNGFEGVVLHRDLAGRDRVLAGRHRR
jgi:release factor glutamine methyltransferase